MDWGLEERREGGSVRFLEWVCGGEKRKEKGGGRVWGELSECCSRSVCGTMMKASGLGWA
jgi:hypothetical protein